MDTTPLPWAAELGVITFLKNGHLTAALIHRLTETSHIFNKKQCEECGYSSAELSPTK